MRRRVSGTAVTAVIVQWLAALERAGRVRSNSGQLAVAQRYGMLPRGGRRPDPRLPGLVPAAGPLAGLSHAELTLLALKYGAGSTVLVERVVDGRRVEYSKRCWARSEDIARELGLTARVVDARIRAIRRKIARALEAR